MALAFSLLAEGIDTTNNPATTASVNPTSGSVTYLVVAYAVAGGSETISTDTVTPSGARGSWETIATLTDEGVDGIGRRGMFIVRGTGTVAAEAISITVNATGGSTWTETAWNVIECTGQDAGTPDDTPVIAAAASGTTSTLGDVGTVDAGDAVLFAVLHETSEAVSAAGWSALGAVTGGSDIRTLHSFYDDSSPDETPNATWSSSSAWGAIGLVVNVGSGGGAAVSLVPVIRQNYRNMGYS